MANYSVLKAAVQAVIKTNGNQEITGANMQSTLISIINSLGTGYQFMGVATPSTSPGTPDYKVFYVGGAGTYTNFGSSYTVPVGSICTFAYNGTWLKSVIKIINGIDNTPTNESENPISSAAVYQLSQELTYLICNTAAATAAKTVDATGYVLSVGGALKIKFTYKNSASNPTLNINSTGAKPILLNSSAISDNNCWEAGETLGFYYDGTSWNGFHLNEYTTAIENPEFYEVTTDKDGRVIEGLMVNGVKVIYTPTDISESHIGDLSVTEKANLFNQENKEVIENVEWLDVMTDENNNIIEGIQKDGTKVISKLYSPIFEKQEKEIDLLNYLNPIFPHTAIVSFVDDDSGKYFADTWGTIMQETGVRIGIACITGMISGEVPATGAYEQMSVEALRGYYESGNEVYSHSWSHPSFRRVDYDEIEYECWKSKTWLLDNGFLRNADTIVYPTGMNYDAETEKRLDVVRRNYRYGVATVDNSNGVNQQPINPLFITRCNADSHTLDYLKERVDTAIAEKTQLVVLTHAYELMGLGTTSLSPDSSVNIQRVIDLINYIKSFDIPILPLCEAIHQIYGW